jgi:hypothetical protein
MRTFYRFAKKAGNQPFTSEGISAMLLLLLRDWQ